MRIKSFVRLLFVFLTISSLAACSLGRTPSTPAPVDTAPPGNTAAAPATEASTSSAETPVPTPGVVQVQGACANSYFPVINGATWTYTASGGPTGDYNYSDTITEVRSDGFSMSSSFSGSSSSTAQWACKPEGLVAQQLPGALSFVTTQGMNASFDTSNVQGVTIPAAINPGDQWSFSMDLHGTQEVSGTSAETTGHMVDNFSAANIESVTVPAGTFDAMKVDGDLTLDLTATVSGLSIPVSLELHTLTWYAPGVGVVKVTTTGDMIGTSLNYVVELQSYNIPH